MALWLERRLTRTSTAQIIRASAHQTPTGAVPSAITRHNATNQNTVTALRSPLRKRRGGSVGAGRPAVPPNPPPVDHAADAGAAASLPAATATVPAIAAAASVTAPVTVTPLAYQVAVDIPCLTRDTGLFVTDAHVLRSLCSHSADDAHPGLTFWMLLPPDFPLTAAVPIRPPHYALLATRTDQAFHMPVVPFDLPARDCTELGLVGTQLYTPKKRKRGEVDTIERAGVLELVRVPHASRRHSQSNVVWIVYHKDMEEFTAWQTAEWFELSEAEQIACAIRSPFNPHRFAFDPANLCVLVPEIDFPGFSAPSWYVKMLGSFFCLHVEQLFAPFYNIRYEGSTTWWVVRTEDREKLEKYIVTRARQWYNVPVSVQLSKVEEDALAGLLYTKHVVFHPSDLVAAGIRVTKVVQLAAQWWSGWVMRCISVCVPCQLTTSDRGGRLRPAAVSTRQSTSYRCSGWAMGCCDTPSGCSGCSGRGSQCNAMAACGRRDCSTCALL